MEKKKNTHNEKKWRQWRKPTKEGKKNKGGKTRGGGNRGRKGERKEGIENYQATLRGEEEVVVEETVAEEDEENTLMVSRGVGESGSTHYLDPRSQGGGRGIGLKPMASSHS